MLEVGQGRLVTRIDGSEGALLDVTDPGDAVHLESSLAIDVSATPTVMLELRGQSVDDGGIGNDNTQEFFFKTGPPGGFLEFLMYDMGGSSVNPSGPDRGCGTDQATPYNRDQISTRSRLQDTQCWDGFLGAPVEWRDPATKSLMVDFGTGTASADLDQVLVAQLDESMGQTIRDLQSPIVWVKNVEKGGNEDQSIESITLYDTSGRETDGLVVLRVPVDPNTGAIVARPQGTFPPDGSVTMEVEESADGPYVPSVDPLALTQGTTELFVRLSVASPADPGSLVLSGIRILYYR